MKAVTCEVCRAATSSVAILTTCSVLNAANWLLVSDDTCMVVSATTCAVVSAMICVLLRLAICEADNSLILLPKPVSWSVDKAAISLLEIPAMSDDVQLEDWLVGDSNTP